MNLADSSSVFCIRSCCCHLHILRSAAPLAQLENLCSFPFLFPHVRSQPCVHLSCSDINTSVCVHNVQYANFKKVTIVCNKYKSKFSKQMEYKLYVLLSPQWPNLTKEKKNLNMLVSKVTFRFMSDTKRWYVCIAVVLYNFYSLCFEFGIEVNNKWLFVCLFSHSIYLPACFTLFYPCVFGSCKNKEKVLSCIFFFWSKICFNKVM